MSPIHVLVCDDQPEITQTWADQISAACENAAVDTLDNGEDFRHLIELLNRRRMAWRRDQSDAGYEKSNPVDKADVIVVDYDLLDYSDTVDTTGSRLAYLLRCFSKCGLVMVLNQYGTNSFDLTLGRPPDSFADIHVGGEQIGNPGLWHSNFDGYRPWHWPIVPDAREGFEECVNDVQNNCDEPILTFLGLHRFVDWVPPRARHFLAGARPIEEVSFRDFVASSHGGVSAKDVVIPNQIARVAAARIATLLNQLILPEQTLLVDAPHLVSRFPSLISTDGEKLEVWNKLCDPSGVAIDDILSACLKAHRFAKPHWLWRPAWYWPEIKKDQNIEEVRDPWATKEVDWVFCENISRFVPEELSDGFRATVSPPFSKRFVVREPSAEVVQYVNRMGDGSALDASKVDYQPLSLFSL